MEDGTRKSQEESTKSPIRFLLYFGVLACLYRIVGLFTCAPEKFREMLASVMTFWLLAVCAHHIEKIQLLIAALPEDHPLRETLAQRPIFRNPMIRFSCFVVLASGAAVAFSFFRT